MPSTRIASPCFARPRFQVGLVACSTGLHQTSSIDMIRVVVACIHHDVLDSTVRCFASFNYASLRHPLNQLRPNPTSFLKLWTLCFSELFSCVQLGSFTPDEVIDLGAVPGTAVLAHMLRTSLKTAISCLTLQTWLMCLFRRTTGRVHEVQLHSSCVVSESSHAKSMTRHIGTCRCITTGMSTTQSRNCTC